MVSYTAYRFLFSKYAAEQTISLCPPNPPWRRGNYHEGFVAAAAAVCGAIWLTKWNKSVRYLRNYRLKKWKINSGANKGPLLVAFSPTFASCPELDTRLSVFFQRPWMFGWEPAWRAAAATKRACDCLICVDYISPQPVCFIPLHRHWPWSLAIFPLMSHIMKWMKCHFQSIAMLIQLN